MVEDCINCLFKCGKNENRKLSNLDHKALFFHWSIVSSSNSWCKMSCLGKNIFLNDKCKNQNILIVIVAWFYVGAFFFSSKDTCIKLIFWCKSIREIHCLELRVLQVDCTVITSPEDPGEKSFQKMGWRRQRRKEQKCFMLCRHHHALLPFETKSEF